MESDGGTVEMLGKPQAGEETLDFPKPPRGILELVLRKIKFWFVRLWMFLVEHRHFPLKLRMIEIGSHFVWEIVGVDPFNKSRFRRAWWDTLHWLVYIPPRHENSLGVTSRDLTVNEHVTARVFKPTPARLHELRRGSHGLKHLRPVLFFHGGGFCVNEPGTFTHHNYCEILASRGLVVVSVHYRLAPEAKFPVPIEDAYAGLLWVIHQGPQFLPSCVDTRKIIVAGDSAGGNIAAVITSLVRDRLTPQLTTAHEIPADFEIIHLMVAYAAFFVYPPQKSMLQLSNGRNFPFLSQEVVHFFLGSYLPEEEGKEIEEVLKEASMNRLLNPMAAGLHNFPRTTVFSADDPLKDDNVAFARGVQANGQQAVSHYHFDHVHGYITFEFMKEAEAALEHFLDDLAPLMFAEHH